MERNTITEVSKLQIGDRFYLVSDKKKLVWQKVEDKVKKTSFQTYGHFAKKDNDLHNTAMKKETQVFFLRNAQTL